MSELNESELGTQEYWNSRYKTEVSNFREHGDVGDIWFGEGSMNRVCRWILNEPLISENSKIIDMGCGNGVFLIELAKKNYKNLVGVDYSEDAITLAKEIAEKENVNITYKVFDIINTYTTETFNCVHDKGTYDAISLSSDAKKNREIYIEKVHKMLDENGLFIITSCNWTQAELTSHFTGNFILLHVIPTPQFSFGGNTGNTVTSLVFKKI